MKRNPMTEEQKELARLRNKKYNAKPEVIAKRQEYYRKPEVRERYKERAQTEEHKKYQEEYRNSERAKHRSLESARARRNFFPKGMTEKLLEIQDNACAVCKTPFDTMNSKSVHADHCHDTKKARGLLCRSCNHVEGFIRKTGLSAHEYLARLAHYLESPPASQIND